MTLARWTSWPTLKTQEDNVRPARPGQHPVMPLADVQVTSSKSTTWPYTQTWAGRQLFPHHWGLHPQLAGRSPLQSDKTRKAEQTCGQTYVKQLVKNTCVPDDWRPPVESKNPLLGWAGKKLITLQLEKNTHTHICVCVYTYVFVHLYILYIDTHIHWGNLGFHNSQCHGAWRKQWLTQNDSQPSIEHWHLN